MRSAIIRTPVALLVAAFAAALPFFTPVAARAGDGAGTGVARISFLAGDVAVRRGDSAAPVAAAINAPLLGADYVTTGDDARAEIQFDGISMVRLGSGTQLRFTHLGAADRALQLAQGTIELRLLRAVAGSDVVDTPSVSVRAHQAGIYRVTVTSDGQTMVTVRAGEAEIVTPQDDRTLDPGNTLIATGAASDPALHASGAIAYDDFDRFNKDRDDRHERALAGAPSYVDRNLEGIDALDGYGRWVNDGSYGQVWAPYNIGSSWAPYRDGRWVWEDQYGWTWVAYEPWGWAPYHYGRWYRSVAYGWCWYPPQPIDLVPIWQPGIVAFFTFGGGGIGWVPLAPYEPYFPWRAFGYGNTYVNNVTNVYVYGPATNGDGMVRRFYKNAPYGTTAQPGKRFLLGKFDHPVPMTAAQLAHVQFVKGALPAVPTAANLRFTDAPVARKLLSGSTSQPSAFAGNAVVERRVPFEQQRAAFAQQRAPVATHAQPRALESVASPWQRFGSARTPEVIVGGAERSSAKAAPHVAPAAPAAAIESVPANGARDASDPWSRFVERGEVTSHAPGTVHRTTPNGMPVRPSAATPHAGAGVTIRPVRADTPVRTVPRELPSSARATESRGSTKPVERSAAARTERAAPVSAANHAGAPRS